MKQINLIRKKVDKIDSEIIKLVSQRLLMTRKIGFLKKISLRKIMNSKREKLVINKWILKSGRAGLAKKFCVKLLKTILKKSILMQKKSVPIISIQGTKGSFSQIMAKKLFPDVIIVENKSFKQAFFTLKSGKADFTVIPVRNNRIGSIKSIEFLEGNEFSEVLKKSMFVNHCLISRKDSSISKLKKIYAHSATLKQCSNFVSANKKINFVSFPDGSFAAEKVLSENNSALIGSEKIAEINNLKILKKGIQDLKNNKTEFAVVMKNE